MRPAGLAVVEAARADGSWNALDEVENLSEPDDLRAALDANPRANRITETTDKAARGERANQWRQPGNTAPPHGPGH